MKAREKLKARDRGILERQFVRQVLTEEGKNLETEHKRAIARLLDQHTGGTMGALDYSVLGTSNAQGVLQVRHSKQQRFLDMKSRTNAQGIRRRKKAYPVHNRIIFGHLNNIIRQLQFGFTEAVQEKLKREITIPISG